MCIFKNLQFENILIARVSLIQERNFNQNHIEKKCVQFELRHIQYSRKRQFIIFSIVSSIFRWISVQFIQILVYCIIITRAFQRFQLLYVCAVFLAVFFYFCTH